MTTKGYIEQKAYLLMSGEEVYRRLEAKPELLAETYTALTKHPEVLARLAIASFCELWCPVEQLADDPDETVRIAALANPAVFGPFSFMNMGAPSFWEKVLKAPERPEFFALIQNPKLHIPLFEHLFRRQVEFAALSDNQWYSACASCLLGNPKFHEGYDAFNIPADGMAWHESNMPEREAFELLLSAPVVKTWANLLNAFLEKVGFGREWMRDAKFYFSAIDRWKGFPHLVETLAWRAAHKAAVGEQRSWLSDHENLIVRRGFYRGLKPQDISELEQFIRRDKDEFIDGFMINQILGESLDWFSWFDAKVNVDGSDSAKDYWLSMRRKLMEKLPQSRLSEGTSKVMKQSS